MTRRRRASYVVVVLGLLAACTSFTEHRASSDAGSSVPDAATVDAVAVPDAASGCDGSFCDDFDDGGLPGHWSRTEIEEGVLAHSTTIVASAPRSLRVTVPPGAGVRRRAVLVHTLPVVPRRLACSLSVRIEEPAGPADGYVSFFELLATAADVREYRLGLALDSGTKGTHLRVDVVGNDAGCACPRAQQALPDLPRGMWNRVTFETDFTTVTIRYGSQDVLVASPGYAIAPTKVEIGIGTSAYSTESAEILYDDVVCSYE